MNRKSELRKIVLDIILGKEQVVLEPSQFGHLTSGVAEVLYRGSRSADSSAHALSEPEHKLDDEDWLLVQEIFWDLITEQIITIGLDSANPVWPWFRLHSEAVQNLECKNSSRK